MKEFEGKVALVTGAGNGIGAAAALLLAERGARVAVSDISKKSVEEVAAQITAKGGEAIALVTDVSDKDAVREMVDATVQKFGKLNCAFNNAGVTLDADAAWDDEAFQRTLAINLTGVMQCMKNEVRYMLQQGGGTIVNTASTAGASASGNPALVGYSASKHGVIGITRTVALKHARDGIRVNAILPGVTLTNMVRGVMEMGPEIKAKLEAYSPMGRMGTPEEMAEAALFLLSERASFINAETLAIDGGFLAQ